MGKRDATMRARLHIEVSGNEPLSRNNAWTMPPNKAAYGSFYKFIKNVQNAPVGRVTGKSAPARCVQGIDADQQQLAKAGLLCKRVGA
jgi:hypothetical protein